MNENCSEKFKSQASQAQDTSLELPFVRYYRSERLQWCHFTKHSNLHSYIFIFESDPETARFKRSIGFGRPKVRTSSMTCTIVFTFFSARRLAILTGFRGLPNYLQANA